jgi:2-dehydro-3-deoxyphosphooctonate aldolase (KDO 8-P synthase)
MVQQIKIQELTIGRPAPFVLISGPCVIEDNDTTLGIADFLKNLTDRLGIPFIFKASYDKANRTSIESYRGPGIEKGLDILSRIREKFHVPVISDVHQINEIALASQVLDVIQIPAFLCRQTDLIVAAANTGKPINIKKGQFLAPWDMKNVVEKAKSTGNTRILLTERGAMFGYNNLVTDFRSVKIMQDTGCPVIFDATHSVQLPGGAGKASAGQREFAPLLARAAIAAGADGIFMEVHKDPDKALSDGANSLKLDTLERVLRQLKAIENALS